MPGLSNALETSILQWLFKQQAALGSVPTTLWISIHNSDPTDTGVTGEVSVTGTAYARQALAPDASTSAGNWSAIGAASSPVTAQQITNNAAITYAVCGATSYNAGAASTFFGLWSLVTAGTFYGSGTINGATGVIVLTGNQLVFPVGNLAFQLD